MARIIDSESGIRRTIKLSTDDILTVVREYQRIVKRSSDYNNTRCLLEDSIIYIPEDV